VCNGGEKNSGSHQGITRKTPKIDHDKLPQERSFEKLPSRQTQEQKGEITPAVQNNANNLEKRIKNEDGEKVPSP